MIRKLSLLFLTAVLLLTGCAQAPDAPAAEPHTASIFAMDTFMDLTVYGDEELLTEATALIYDLEKKLSVTDEKSEVSALNRDKSASLSEDTASLLADGLALCRRTGGALDLTIYPVVRAWGFTTDAYRVPDRAELDELLTRVDYTAVTLEGTAASLGEDMLLDLGSVAKGCASARVIDLFRRGGASSALLSLGGNVHCLGAKPDGTPWRIAIQDPLGNGYLGVVSVTDKAVITSGGYERYFVEDGVTYWHILDPATGAPARSGLISVSVIGENGLTCDGLSTALFVMGLDEAARLWRESDDFEAIFVSEDGSVAITEGLEDSFHTEGAYKMREVTVIRRG